MSAWFPKYAYPLTTQAKSVVAHSNGSISTVGRNEAPGDVPPLSPTHTAQAFPPLTPSKRLGLRQRQVQALALVR